MYSVYCVTKKSYFYNDVLTHLEGVENGENVLAYNSWEKSKYPGQPQQGDKHHGRTQSSSAVKHHTW